MSAQMEDMKLRLRHNSIRFRLGQSEVQHLETGEPCRELILFPGNQRLEYILEPSAGMKIAASFESSVIRITIPQPELFGWCQSDQVGLSAELTAGDGLVLRILIEKDFRCLDGEVSEDQSDTFENPAVQHTGC